MWVCAPALRPPPRIVSMSSLKSGSSPSALSRAAANSSSICRVHTGQKVAQYHKSRLWGGTGLSFTLRCLFSCSFGKLALSSNRVNVKSACPKLSILHRPAAACSISLERLASVVLLLLFLVSQGIASSESGLGARQARPTRGNYMAILLTQSVASSSTSCRLNRLAPPTANKREIVVRTGGQRPWGIRGSPCFDGSLGAPSRPGSAV